MIDSVYIKMSREAKEIQELWHPKLGDNYFFKTERDIIDNEYQTITVDLLAVHGLLAAGEVHWLPRIEDLQEIAENKDRLLPSLQKLQKYFKKLSFTEMGIKIPIKWVDWWNILWLCFVMETCFGKRWDNNDERWVNLLEKG